MESEMNQDDAFLWAIVANPEDRTTRLVYADWLEERGDPRGEFLRLEAALASMPIDDEKAAAGRQHLLELRERISPSWLAQIWSCRSISSAPDPQRIERAAEWLGRQVAFVDTDGYDRAIVAAAVHFHQQPLAYVESRQQWHGRVLDIHFHLRIQDRKDRSAAWEIASYNPFFGCDVRFLEWIGETVLLIYHEKRHTYICRFGIDFPAKFKIIEDRWVLDGSQLGHQGFQETSVRRLTIPGLEELPSLSSEVAAKWQLLP
jgi:uncharacterized protein (TIGR02996 family)